MRQGYQLIVIENEKVPMAAGAGRADSSFWLMLAVMLAVAALVFLWFYLMRCRRYRKRIRELDPGGGEYRGWNMRRLKWTLAELELDLITPYPYGIPGAETG